MATTGDEYSMVIAQCFLKDMRKLSRQDQIRVRLGLEVIKADPYKGVKVSASETGQYRWRVGNLRFRYDIDRRQINILLVIKREDAYRKF